MVGKGVKCHYRWTQDVEISHQERCDSQGHEWEGCLGGWPLKVYQACRWCGVKK